MYFYHYFFLHFDFTVIKCKCQQKQIRKEQDYFNFDITDEMPPP